MSSQNKNLSDVGLLPKLNNVHVGIVVSEWNSTVTYQLLEGALKTLQEAGLSQDQITTLYVPGTYELALAAQNLGTQNNIHAVICLGCVVQGETPHFDYVCSAAAQGIINVGLQLNKPVIFGVLTTLNNEQALDRAGGKHGNKGTEAAATALKMLHTLNPDSTNAVL